MPQVCLVMHGQPFFSPLNYFFSPLWFFFTPLNECALLSPPYLTLFPPLLLLFPPYLSPLTPCVRRASEGQGEYPHVLAVSNCTTCWRGAGSAGRLCIFNNRDI